MNFQKIKCTRYIAFFSNGNFVVAPFPTSRSRNFSFDPLASCCTHTIRAHLFASSNFTNDESTLWYCCSGQACHHGVPVGRFHEGYDDVGATGNGAGVDLFPTSHHCDSSWIWRYTVLFSPAVSELGSDRFY